MGKDLLPRLATMIREAALQAAEDVIKEKKEDLATLIARVVSPIAASFLSAFSGEFVLLCIQALTNEHKSEKILMHLSNLVAGPLNTGILQLRTSLALEASAQMETPEQKTHRISRYRHALRSFDEALALAQNEEKPAIHLYRALVSKSIPGAEVEAHLHIYEFATACNNLAEELIRKAVDEESAALSSELSAAKITVDQGIGAGGGLVGMSIAADKIKKSQLEASARSRRAIAEGFRNRARDLKESSVLVTALI